MPFFKGKKILETSILSNWKLPVTNPQTWCLLRDSPFPLRKTLTLSKSDNQYRTNNTFKGCFSTYHKVVCVEIRRKHFLQDISTETNNKKFLKLVLNARTEFSWPNCLNLSVVFINLSFSHLKFLWVSPNISLATVWKETAEPLWLISWSEQIEKLLFTFTTPFEPAVCEVSSIYTFEKGIKKKFSGNYKLHFSILLKSSSRWKLKSSSKVVPEIKSTIKSQKLTDAENTSRNLWNTLKAAPFYVFFRAKPWLTLQAPPCSHRPAEWLQGRGQPWCGPGSWGGVWRGARRCRGTRCRWRCPARRCSSEWSQPNSTPGKRNHTRPKKTSNQMP